MANGLFLGRFQPFHNGHLSALKRAEQECGSVIVAVGSAQYGYYGDNPLTGSERMELISSVLRREISKPFYVVPVEDIQCYPRYVSHIESLVPKFDVVYTGNEIVRSLFAEKGYEVRWLDRQDISATMIRDRIVAGQPWDHLVPSEVSNFIRGNGIEARIKESYHVRDQRKMPTLTVDAIIEYQGGIVLIERGHSPFKGKWALPGGHLVYNESLEDAVRCEVMEETGLILTDLRQLGAYSYPQRDPRGHYVSVVFTCKGDGVLRSGDDAVKAQVYRLGELPELAFDHGVMLHDYRMKNI